MYCFRYFKHSLISFLAKKHSYFHSIFHFESINVHGSVAWSTSALFRLKFHSFRIKILFLIIMGLI